MLTYLFIATQRHIAPRSVNTVSEQEQPNHVDAIRLALIYRKRISIKWASLKTVSKDQSCEMKPLVHLALLVLIVASKYALDQTW